MRITTSGRGVPPKRVKHYVNNRELYDALVVYQRARRASTDDATRPEIPRYVGVCLMMICDRLSMKPNFIGYSYRDEMIADAIENCVAAVDNFDPDRGKNPFAYFTQIAYNAMIRRIGREKKQSYVKHKHMEHMMTMGDDVQLQELDTYHPSGGKVGEGASSGMARSQEVIRSFEESLANRKEKGSKPKVKFNRWARKEKKIPDEDRPRLGFSRVGRNNV